jgi:hypothetical protein
MSLVLTNSQPRRARRLRNMVAWTSPGALRAFWPQSDLARTPHSGHLKTTDLKTSTKVP